MVDNKEFSNDLSLNYLYLTTLYDYEEEFDNNVDKNICYIKKVLTDGKKKDLISYIPNILEYDKKIDNKLEK